MDSGFDRIAWLYDLLARLFTLGAVQRSQRLFIDDLPDHGKLLFIGGGTGGILPELVRKKPNLEIYYVEASGKMLQKAQRRSESGSIQFIFGTEQAIPNVNFDVVLTFFFLDVFKQQRLNQVLEIIKSKLNKGAVWWVADFDQRNFKERSLRGLFVRLLYWFFRFVTNLEGNSLLPFFTQVSSGNRSVSKKRYLGGLITSEIFKVN